MQNTHPPPIIRTKVKQYHIFRRDAFLYFLHLFYWLSEEHLSTHLFVYLFILLGIRLKFLLKMKSFGKKNPWNF